MATRLLLILFVFLPFHAVHAQYDDSSSEPGLVFFPSRWRTYSEVARRFEKALHEQVKSPRYFKRFHSQCPPEDELDELLAPVLRADQAHFKSNALDRFALLKFLDYEFSALRLIPLERLKERLNVRYPPSSRSQPLGHGLLDGVVTFWIYSAVLPRLQPESRYRDAAEELFYTSLVGLAYSLDQLPIPSRARTEILAEVFSHSTATQKDLDGYLERIEDISPELFNTHNHQAYRNAIATVPLPTAGASKALETWVAALLSGFLLHPWHVYVQPLPDHAAFIAGPALILASAWALFKHQYAGLEKRLERSFADTVKQRQLALDKASQREFEAFSEFEKARPVLRHLCADFFD